MKYFVSNLIVLIFATQIAWGGSFDVEATARLGNAAHAVRAHAQGEPRQHIPFTLRADAEEFSRIYGAMPNPDNNPYQLFFGTLFNRYYDNSDEIPYPENVTSAILMQGSAEYAFYLKFSGLRRLAGSDNFNPQQQLEVYELNKTFTQRITGSFRDMPSNPYYEFVIAALKLNYAEIAAKIDLRENAAKLVRFSISSLEDGKVRTELERHYERSSRMNGYPEALSYLRRYHQTMYESTNKDFVKFSFRVPKVLIAPEWDACKMGLFDKFNELIASKLGQKRKYHQKLLPDLKSIFWRALGGAMGGLAYSAVPTVNDHQLDFSFNSQKATSAAIAAGCGSVVSVVGGSMYNWFFCPPVFRLGDGDYVREINLLSAYCTEQVVQNYGRVYNAVKFDLIAEKVADVILHDSIGLRKYIRNKLLRKNHPLPFTEIFGSYWKLPSTIFADYPGLRDLFTIE